METMATFGMSFYSKLQIISNIPAQGNNVVVEVIDVILVEKNYEGELW